MTIKHLLPAFLCLALVTAAPPALAERSPIFGEAAIEVMSSADARGITARGYWADYYGSAAVNQAYSAYIYSFYGRFYAASNSTTEQSWYNTASTNAYYAYIYSYYASYYSSVGM